MGRVILAALCAAALSGCGTVVGAPATLAEGSSEWIGERLTDIRKARLPTPRLRDIPPPPENVRSDGEWEAAYQELATSRDMLLRDPVVVDAAPDVSPEEFIEDVRSNTTEARTPE